MSENLAKIYRKYGVPTYFQPYNTVRSQLVRPKDQTPALKKCGVIYELNCEDCEATYVGETSRSFETRIKEHRKLRGQTTAVGDHLKDTGHKLAEDKSRVIAREQNFWPRKIHEAIEIRIRQPELNRDTGYHLPLIYYTLLKSDPKRGAPRWSELESFGHKLPRFKKVS